MITEDYVSFEVAKLLKEKGFNEPCLMCYTSDEKLGNYGHYNSYKNSDVFALTTPTIQMTMKWLREVHHLHIMVDCIGSKNYLPTVQNTGNSNDYKVEGKRSRIGGNGFDSYEETCEVAIKYCLDHLI